MPPVPLPPVPQPDPMPRPDLAPVPVPAPAPVAPLVDDKALPDGGEHHGEVQALPDEPDTIPDSVVDGARFGRLVARAGATRGAVPRRDRRLRRQHAALAVINRCDPPLLLSAVAAGRPGSAVPSSPRCRCCAASGPGSTSARPTSMVPGRRSSPATATSERSARY
ncbi:hypothetical protein [Phytohabitans flavus]|uniref:hypothetical protein n=1 Tax=Phytohabitans flavus TaxID=1076124 RepID=UPI00156389D0|nr:hypothetical protein [Phytohabitans flavus]